MIWEEATASLKENNMGLNSVPSGERIHIGFFGKRNAGKSSLVNKFTNQKLSVVSDVPGTTTDPVKKAMEILPLGPVVIIDTPGFDDVGAIKAGYKADIAILDLNRPQFFPRNDLTAALVYSANGSEVDTVIIDGEIVLENGRLTKFDEEKIYAEAQKIADKF